MLGTFRRPFIVTLIAATLVMLVAVPAVAAHPGTNHRFAGVATFDTLRCPGALDMAPQEDGWGLDGCLFLTSVDAWSLTPSGVYKEYGTEQFVGTIVHSAGGVPDESTRSDLGSFDTAYTITSKWAGEPFASEQFHGRCQHPIIPGTGDGGFAGATGRLDIKDTIVDGVAVEFPYRGNVTLSA